MVFIPGLGTDVRMSKRVIGDLAAHFRVLAFDPRGAGRSDKPDAPYSMGMMAEDAIGPDGRDRVGQGVPPWSFHGRTGSPWPSPCNTLSGSEPLS